MIKYTKEEMLSILIKLENWPTMYVTQKKNEKTFATMEGFLRDLYDRGCFEYGFSKEGGSQGAVIACRELGNTFPDVLYALFMGQKELPLYVGKDGGQELPIAVWRLENNK